VVNSDPALAALFLKQFAWCKVVGGESVAVLTEPESRETYAEAAQAAASALGARPFRIVLPSHAGEVGAIAAINRGNASSTILDDLPEVTGVLSAVDFIVDLTLDGLIHSKQRAAIQKGGARVLLVREPPDALARLLPTAERTARIARAAERLGRAKTMTVTSAAGTNLRVDLAGAAVRGSPGFCDKPGSSATWAIGAVLVYPPSAEIEGDVVLAPGDIVYPFYRYVDRPVTLRFKGGFVAEIEGDGVDAELMRDYLARWGDPNAYGISHVGWGLHERALWDALAFYPKGEAAGVDGRCFAGNFLISTGPNYAANRHTACHFDLPMRHCTVALDGEPVVETGRLVDRP